MFAKRGHIEFTSGQASSERGQALPLALVALALGMLVISPFLGHVGSSLVSSGTYTQAIALRYAADAGVEYAIWYLQKGEPQVPQGGELQLPQFAVNGKAVDVIIYSEGGQIYQIVSTAADEDEGSVTIRSRISLGGSYEFFPDNFKLAEDEQYDGNVWTEGNVQLDKGAQLTGNVFAMGNVQLERDAQITGNVWAEGNVQLDDGAQINGAVCVGGDVQLDLAAQIIGDVRDKGNVQLAQNALIDGDVYVYSETNVQLDPGAEITGSIYPYDGCPSIIGEADTVILSWEVTHERA